jgi:hypothetical protein
MRVGSRIDDDELDRPIRPMDLVDERTLAVRLEAAHGNAQFLRQCPQFSIDARKCLPAIHRRFAAAQQIQVRSV